MFNLIIESVYPNVVYEQGQLNVGCTLQFEEADLINNSINKNLGLNMWATIINHEGAQPEPIEITLKNVSILGISGTISDAPDHILEANLPNDHDWTKTYLITSGGTNSWVIDLSAHNNFKAMLSFDIPSGTKSGNLSVHADMINFDTQVGVYSASVILASSEVRDTIKVADTPTAVIPDLTERPVLRYFQDDPQSGEFAIVVGDHFGTDPGFITIDSYHLSTDRINYWTNNQIRFEIPRNTAPGLRTFKVKRKDLNVYSLPYRAVVEGISLPSISSTSVQGSLIRGRVHNIVICGTGFTNIPGTVSLGSTALIVNNWSNTEIECSTPTSIVSGDLKVVTYEANVSNSISIVFIDPVPSITSIIPDIVEEGKEIAIVGTGFGQSEGSVVLSSASANLIVKTWNDQAIIAEVGYGSEPGNITVHTSFGADSNSYPIAVTVPSTQEAPQILRISPSGGPQGSTIKLLGKNFGSYKIGSCYAMVGNVSLEIIQGSWTNSEVSAKIPVGAKTSYIKVITPAGESNEAMFIVSDEPLKDDVVVHPKPPVNRLQPIITKIDPPYYSPGNSKVTIFGRNFGKAVGQVKIGGASLQIVPNTWTNNFVQAYLPTTPQKALIQVTTSSGVSNKIPYLITNPIPKISTVSPTNTTVGNMLTITGTNFGPGTDNGTNYLRTGNAVECLIPRNMIASWTSTSISFMLNDSIDYTSGRIQVIAENLKSDWKGINVSYIAGTSNNNLSSSGDIRNTSGQLVVTTDQTTSPMTGIPVGSPRVVGLNAEKISGMRWLDIKEYIDSKFKSSAIMANELHTLNGVEPGSNNDIKICGAGNIDVLKNTESHEIIVVMNPLEGQNNTDLLAKLGSVVVNTGNIAGVDASDGFVASTHNGIVTLSIDFGMGPNQVPPGDHTHPESDRIPVYQ